MRRVAVPGKWNQIMQMLERRKQIGKKISVSHFFGVLSGNQKSNCWGKNWYAKEEKKWSIHGLSFRLLSRERLWVTFDDSIMQCWKHSFDSEAAKCTFSRISGLSANLPSISVLSFERKDRYCGGRDGNCRALVLLTKLPRDGRLQAKFSTKILREIGVCAEEVKCWWRNSGIGCTCWEVKLENSFLNEASFYSSRSCNSCQRSLGTFSGNASAEN